MDEIVNKIIKKSYSQLISDGFELYALNFLKLVLVWLIFTSLTILIAVFIFYPIMLLYYRNISLYALIFLLERVIFSIIAVIKICLVSNYLYDKYLQKHPNFIDSFKNAFNERLKYPMVIFIIIGLISCSAFLIVGIILGDHPTSAERTSAFIILNIIGIIMYVVITYYIFSIFTYNIEDIEKPLHEAKLLTKGSFWKVLAVQLIPIPILMVASIPFYPIYKYFWSMEHHITSNIGYQGFIFLFSFIFSIPFIILGPLELCLLTPLFAKQFLKEEETDLKK